MHGLTAGGTTQAETGGAPELYKDLNDKPCSGGGVRALDHGCHSCLRVRTNQVKRKEYTISCMLVFID
jgi:hypothetical protein